MVTRTTLNFNRDRPGSAPACPRTAKGHRQRRWPSAGQRTGSDHPDVLGLLALAARGHVELDLLALLEGLVAVALDVRVVDEDVVRTLAGDEAVALLVVEELDGTGSHCLAPES